MWNSSNYHDVYWANGRGIARVINGINDSKYKITGFN